MFSYREEFIKRANTHQTHFESLVLLGPDGLDEIKDKISRFFNKIENNEDSGLNLTTKIDGSPALIVWSKFTGYPDNSICLKSFVNNANNVISSEDEIEERYGDRPSMAEKLIYGLQLARLIPEGEAWQGDCLFTEEDKHVEIIHDKEYITFQPNKIVYAFSEENPGYESVKSAEFGIAFHTVYKDDGNGGKSQSFRPAIDQVLWPDWAYIMSPALNINKDNFNLDEIKQATDKFNSLANELAHNSAYKDLINNEVFMRYWNTFENMNIADKKQAQLNTSSVINDLKDYVSEKQTAEFQKKFSSLKTSKGRITAIDKWAGAVAELKDIIDYNEETIVLLVKTLNAAAAIKMMMWSGFKNSSQDYSTFFKSRSKGIIDANMEGVAMSDADGNIVKIVDRTEFSSANRDPDILAGWEHPGENIKEEFDIKRTAFDRILMEGVGRLSISNLNYKNGEYMNGYKSFIRDGKPLNCSKTQNSEIVQIIIEPDEELLSIEDSEEFASELAEAILAKDSTIKWVEKPRESTGMGAQDIRISTNFQEAIQGYLFEKFWNNPLKKDSDCIEELFSEDFKERINWGVCDADFKKFKADISSTLTNKGYASSGSWLSYFIAIAKEGSKKIQDLYKEGHKLSGSPVAFARGLNSNINSLIDEFFANSLFGKPKDRFNKADILLVFSSSPEETAKDYIESALSSSTLEEYCSIVDRALSDGSVIGLSLKKGDNQVHAELLAATTSINREVFGEDASTAIIYNGEKDPYNTFASFKDTCDNPEQLCHIKDFKFVPFITRNGEQGLTSEIRLPVNDEYKKDFSDYIKIGIRSNDREKESVTVEPYKRGANALLGKWPTIMQEELGVSMPKKSSPDMSHYDRCVEKIDTYLDCFRKVYESDKSDLYIATFFSSCGYPLANNESGEVKLITAPFIKIS